MIEGRATKISFARELTLLGARASVLTAPGKFQFAASKQVKTKISRQNPWRHQQDAQHAHTFYNVELSGEMDFNEFIYGVLAMLFNEFDEQNLNSLYKSVNYYLRGENPGSYCKFWIKLEDGTIWRAEGAAIIDFQLTVESRKLLTFNASIVALKLAEASFVEAEFSYTHKPLTGAHCQIYTTDDAAWPVEAGLAAKKVLSYAGRFNYRTEYEPAQFGLDGFASKYRKGVASVNGVIVCESPDAGELLTGVMGVKHLLSIEHPANDQRFRFYFDRTLSTIVRQETLSEGKLVNVVEFEAKEDATTGLSRLEIVKLRTDPPDIALPFDFAVIRYKWTAAGGTDLDTRTAVIGSGDISIDGVDVGWSRAATVVLNTFTILTWGGDNVTNTGPEAILVDFKKIAEQLPALEFITIRLRSFWFDTRASGDHTIQFQTYLGGTMQASGLDFVNAGGVTQQTIEVDRNAITNIGADVDGDEQGTLVYEVETQTANILDP